MHSLIIILASVGGGADGEQAVHQNMAASQVQSQSCEWSDENPDKTINETCRKLIGYLKESENLVRQNYNEMNDISSKCIKAAKEFDRKRGGLASRNFDALFSKGVNPAGPIRSGKPNVTIETEGTKCTSISEDELVKEIAKLVDDSAIIRQIQSQHGRTIDFRAISTFAALEQNIELALSSFSVEKTPEYLWAARAMTESLGELLQSISRYYSAKAVADRSRAKLAQDYARFASAVDNTSDLALTGGHKPEVNRGVKMADCRIPSPNSIDPKQILSVRLFKNLNGCALLLRVEAAIAAGRSPSEVPTSLTGGEIAAGLATAASGTNLEVTFKNEFSRISTWYEDGVQDKRAIVRRPSTWGFSVGAEASADDGIASLFASGSDSNNIFGLKQLNASVALKGSAGFNFYPKQTEADFKKAAGKFLKKAAAACEKSIAANETRVDTECGGESLLLWLYEGKDGKYSRSALLQEYTKLLWNSDATYPEFGFGLEGRLAFPQPSFKQLLDDERVFDPGLIGDVDDFFGDPADKARNPERLKKIDSGVALTVGAYGYRHFPAEKSNWYEGVTFRGSGSYKRDLPDNLSDNKIEICRTDLLGSAQVVSLADACRTVLPFEPKFQDTFVMDLEGRFGFKAIGRWPAFGVAPKVEYETGDDTEKFRFSMPVYFTPKDKELTGGIGFARNVDYQKPAESEWNVYLFFGKKFSLNGAN